ncbi:MAG: transglutaminase-like domain-containing protein [Ruminococcus sp.]|nr:transglutaminase-like domain-containing protein [Ruminococcus sp.]
MKNTVNRKQKMLEKLNIMLCPALLGALVCFTIVYILYRPMAAFYTIIFFIAEFLLFSLFDVLQRKKRLGGMLYMLIMVLITILSIQLIFIGAQDSDISPITWFYGENGSYYNASFYLLAIFVGGGFFLISILYYFTQVRYRSLGVMLCILFPFVIYAKRADEVPEILVTLIITVFLALMVHNRRKDPAIAAEKRSRLKIDPSYLISVALFVSVTGAITMLVDKPEYQSQLEQNANYFDAVQTDATGSGNYDSMTETSSQRYGGDSGTGEILFYFTTDGDADEYFLRRQVYDNFNGEVWEIDEDFYNDYPWFYSQDYPEYSTDDILQDMLELMLSGADLNGAQPSENLLELKSGYLYGETFTPIYLPAPYTTIADEDVTYFVRNTHSDIYRQTYSEKNLDQSFSFYDYTDEFYEYVEQLNLDMDSYMELLEDSEELSDDFYDVYEKYLSLDSVSSEVAELAKEITADCDSSYEMACALESYFEENGYVYDIDYVPDDESIEYFIFEGKTGVCSSYATAMTLMARAVGLPARYVEGFAAFEKNDEGQFVIRDSYAHAFVEVYIPGAGWLTFDPTVSGYMDIEEESSFDTAAFLQILSRLLVVIIVVFVIVFILFLDRIIELIFRIRLRFKKSYADKTLALYANVIKLVNYSSQENYISYTVNMLRDYLKASRGISLDSLLELFEKTCFGGYSPTESEFKEAYAEYKSVYKYLRKLPKEKKLAKQRALAKV